MTITGATRLAGVIDWSVRHSVSPAIHNAAFAALGLDWCYVALPVRPGRAASAVAGMDAMGIEGLSVTMPHKAPVAASLDHLTGDAASLGAVNCVFREGERLVGDNTDGSGFVDSLHDADVDPGGASCVVLGAGGAGRAVVRGLATAGAARVVVVNRNAERATQAAALAGDRGVVGEPAALATADLVVNATPVGMGDDTRVALDVDTLADGAVVADLVYHPRVTPLLAAAAAAGHRTVGGLGMLVHQAGRAFERWTGERAPVAAMQGAALRVGD